MKTSEAFYEDYFFGEHELSEVEMIALASRDLISKLRTLNDRIEEVIYMNKYHDHALTRERLEGFSQDLTDLLRSYS